MMPPTATAAKDLRVDATLPSNLPAVTPSTGGTRSTRTPIGNPPGIARLGVQASPESSPGFQRSRPDRRADATAPPPTLLRDRAEPRDGLCALHGCARARRHERDGCRGRRAP